LIDQAESGQLLLSGAYSPSCAPHNLKGKLHGKESQESEEGEEGPQEEVESLSASLRGNANEAESYLQEFATSFRDAESSAPGIL